MAQATLTITSKNYGAWSLRGWLLCKMAGLDLVEKPVDIDDLLSSDRYAYLLNADGPMPGRVIQIASR